MGIKKGNFHVDWKTKSFKENWWSSEVHHDITKADTRQALFTRDSLVILWSLRPVPWCIMARVGMHTGPRASKTNLASTKIRRCRRTVGLNISKLCFTSIPCTNFFLWKMVRFVIPHRAGFNQFAFFSECLDWADYQDAMIREYQEEIMRLKVRRFFFTSSLLCFVSTCESLVKWHLCTVSCMYVETYVQKCKTCL